jgi:NADH-quinone oxidoreductase chain I
VAVLKFDKYGIGIAKGMVETMRNFFRAPITVQYPEEKLTVSRRIRGNEMVWFPDKCTGCATCAKSCPQGNIEIVTHKDDSSNNYIVDKFEIDTGRCMFCGLCVEACPYEALAFGISYERAQYRRMGLVLAKEDILPDKRTASGYARPAIEKTLPKQSLLLYPDKEEGGQKLKFLPRTKKRGRGA